MIYVSIFVNILINVGTYWFFIVSHCVLIGTFADHCRANGGVGSVRVPVVLSGGQGGGTGHGCGSQRGGGDIG